MCLAGEHRQKTSHERNVGMPITSKDITEEELQEFREIFDLVDEDKSGEISKDELKKLMITLGLKPTDEQIDTMMKEVDEDGSGDIDFSEFVKGKLSEVLRDLLIRSQLQ